MALKETAVDAMKLARTIASDIKLYNSDAIIEALEKDNVWEVLEADIVEGQKNYRSRVAPKILAETNFFERALVDIVLMPHGNRKSPIW